MVGLTINAYFIKEMLGSLNQVKLQTAVLIEKSSSKETRLNKVERDIKEIRLKHHDLVTSIIELKFAGTTPDGKL